MDKDEEERMRLANHSFASTFLKPTSQASATEHGLVEMMPQELEVQQITIEAQTDNNSPSTPKKSENANKDSLIVLKSSVHSDAKSRNIQAKQHEKHYDETNDPAQSLYEPHHHHLLVKN